MKVKVKFKNKIKLYTKVIIIMLMNNSCKPLIIIIKNITLSKIRFSLIKFYSL